MKIIRTDNFCRDTVADRLVADNIKNQNDGLVMVKALQATCHKEGNDWYRLVGDDYRLSRGIADHV